jgi:hypothetical protein
MFIGQKEHNVFTALQKSAENYNTFKLSFLTSIESIDQLLSPVEAVDLILSTLNQNKVYENSYYYSDMVGYGTAEVVRTWTVDRLTINNASFPLSADFDLTSLSQRAVYVYKNGEQLLHGIDYVFNTITSTVDIITSVEIDDVIVVNDFKDNTGNYIPFTPSKLGL